MIKGASGTDDAKKERWGSRKMGVKSVLGSSHAIFQSRGTQRRVKNRPDTFLASDYPSSKLVTPNHLSRGKAGSTLLYILVVLNTSVMP